MKRQMRTREIPNGNVNMCKGRESRYALWMRPNGNWNNIAFGSWVHITDTAVERQNIICKLQVKYFWRNFHYYLSSNLWLEDALKLRKHWYVAYDHWMSFPYILEKHYFNILAYPIYVFCCVWIYSAAVPNSTAVSLVSGSLKNW